MTEKIEWYREVLELEPNSKVFFPLGRLLAEEGRITDAIAILQNGLERHPEYLEARLFLIEVLHTNGFEADCARQVDILSKMFASYAGFWQAWAACLSSEKEADTASVLRFLAAQFVAGPVQLHDVLNRGLDALFSEAECGAKKHVPLPVSQPSVPLIEPPCEPEGPADMKESAKAATSGEPVAPRVDGNAQDVDLPETLADAAADPLENGDMPGISEEEDLPSPVESVADLPVAENAEPLEEAVMESVGESGEIEAGAAGEDVSDQDTEEALPDALGDLPAVEDSAEPSEAQTDEALDLADLDAALEEVEEPERKRPVFSGEQSMLNMEAAIEDLNLPGMGEVPPKPDLRLEGSEAPAVEEPETVSIEEPGLVEDTPEVAVGMETSEVREPAETEPVLEAEDALPEPDTLLEEGELPVIEEEAAGSDGMEDKEGDAGSGEADEDVELESQVNAHLNLESGTGENEEQFSLRTRSMAEVLAEQGDIQGALDIYHELAAAASDKYEAEDIHRRIATLNGRLNAELAGEYEEPEPQPSSRDKLITMLEALANRVEERAQSYGK